jgi:DNA polymerase-3 subunit alpha
VGRRALESLVKVGALDSLCPRCDLLEALDRMISLSAAHFRAKEVGQLSLFGASTGVSETIEVPATTRPVSARQQLGWEKELLGVYLSDHPLTPYIATLSEVVTHYSAELREAAHEQSVCVAGEVSHVRPYQTRSGKSMGFVTLEDLQGGIEVVVFNRVWKTTSEWLQPGKIVVVKGRVDNERGDPKVLADEVTEGLPTASDRAGSQPAGERPGREPASPPEESGAPEAAEPPEAGLPAEVWWPETVEEPASGLAMDEPPSPALQEAQVALTMMTDRPAPAGNDPRMLTIRLESSGDKERDARRMRRVHGLLTSYPGRDHFVFQVYEASRRYHLEFPNSTTGFCPELHRQLMLLLGEGAVKVERLRIQ